MGEAETVQPTATSFGPFVERHIGPDAAEVRAMLEVVGASSLDALIDETVPQAIRQSAPLELPPPLSEPEALARLAGLAAQNEVKRSLIGMGYYGTHTPAVLLRNLFENPGWYTAYTPYQAEISQGRLEALLNWQQAVVDLTGMELANASLLDEATAAAEAMTLAHRTAKSKAEAFFVDQDTHPQTKAVLRTRAVPLGIAILEGDPLRDLEAGEVFGALFSYPGSSGEIRDFRPAVEALHGTGAVVAVASDLLALCLLEAPGKWGADIVLGSAQRFGVPMGMGGPHAAFFATRDAIKRSMPGRIIGVSQDARGKPALRMALQTREQHIRREKATSNICTAQVLLAVMAGMYAVWHGAKGLKAIAERVHGLTADLAGRLEAAGIERTNSHFFDTLTLATPGRAAAIVERAAEAGFNLRPLDDGHVALSFDETVTAAEVDVLAGILGGAGQGGQGAGLPEALPESLRRQTAYLTHPVFGLHRSETEMLRYLRKLQLKDLALDRSMIPLGSCTMKLNAAVEMMPVSMAGFAHIHPFAPEGQTKGYRTLFADLEEWLCRITGFDAVSLQPNAGSQGEYAGLLTIRAYHLSRGDADRDICLIPSSAHGTNPASAVMAGMRVVVVGCDDQGNVDLADLTGKAEAHKERLAALMITYPSTHGVFEAHVKDVCAVVHANGGQVYLDGANLNALVGLCRPAEIGADVSHMNLHKTFCIPHGGGGPGMGPIGVKAHLAPFLPGHPVTGEGGPESLGTISAAAFGSPSILPITWAYIALMGAKGLTRASEMAILNANYIATRLKEHYPVVYAGKNGRVAHECIIDFRGIKHETGISSEDVAKRLVDYGFHAPTMSWPVPETMMIEPTESEAKSELDRFCAAMIGIREEIRAIERGESDKADNPLKHAPHTADLLLGEWTRGYDKTKAFAPLGGDLTDKYWPPVARVDNVYGDRHVVCTCPPLEDYAEAAE
jgi:glycine dehydrogenase